MKSRLKILSCLATLAICASVTPSFSAMKRAQRPQPITLPQPVLPSRYEPRRPRSPQGLLPKRARREGFTPLIDAIVRDQNLDAIQLIRRGADVNKTDDRGNTPLHVAMDNYSSPSVFHLIEILVRKMEDINAENQKGETALTLAKINLNVERYNNAVENIEALSHIIEILEEHGAVDPKPDASSKPIVTIEASEISSFWFSAGILSK